MFQQRTEASKRKITRAIEFLKSRYTFKVERTKQMCRAQKEIHNNSKGARCDADRHCGPNMSPSSS